MVIVARKAINEYATQNAQATEALNERYLKTKNADRGCLADVKNTVNSVDYAGNDNYVFNIKGNHYRLITRTPHSAYKPFLSPLLARMLSAIK